MARQLMFGVVMAAVAAAPAMAQRTVSPPNALPPVPVLPSYNSPIQPNYNRPYQPGYATPYQRGYGAPYGLQQRIWVQPYYDRFGNFVPGYWR